jgi:hypothetical protein
MFLLSPSSLLLPPTASSRSTFREERNKVPEIAEQPNEEEKK